MWSAPGVDFRSSTFLLYITDLCNVSKALDFMLLADNTNIFCSC